jgi:hypothetical protein
MKPQTYFRLALLFPYVLWGVCALIFFTLQSIFEIPEAWNIVLMPMTFYVFGIILWLIPYTLLAIGLGIWGRNKSTDTLRKMAFAAPILFFILMLIEVVLVSLPAESIAEFIKELLAQSAMLGVFSLVFGYLCVGIALGIFKFMQTKKLIAEESPIPLLET